MENLLENLWLLGKCKICILPKYARSDCSNEKIRAVAVVEGN